MDIDENFSAKVEYEKHDGGKTTAYLDRQISEIVFSGTNKHTDEKVVVYWIEEDQKYIEGFEDDTTFKDWVQQELFHAYQKEMFETVYGPAVYGDRSNFVVYQLPSGDWEMKPADGYIAEQVRGIFNVIENQEE